MSAVRTALAAALLTAAVVLPAVVGSTALAQPDASKQAGAGKASRQAAAPAGGGKPLGDWRSGAVTTDAGAFAYCVAENRFDNGLVLVIGRNAEGEMNVAIGIPGGGLSSGQKWPVTVTLDGKTQRRREAIAADPDLLVVVMGKDEEFFNAMVGGRKLDIVGPTDTASFQLKGTSKALGELRKCVEQGRAGGGKPAKPGASAATAKPALPEALATILQAAGLKDVVALKLDGMPEGQRPADFAWRFGPVFGGVRETQVADDRNLNALTTAYLDGLKQKCGGEFASSVDDVETLPEVSLRRGTVSCVSTRDGKTDKINVALLFYLTRSRLFTVFFHEAQEADREVAVKARDNITGVIRTLATEPPPNDGAGKDGASKKAGN